MGWYENRSQDGIAAQASVIYTDPRSASSFSAPRFQFGDLDGDGDQDIDLITTQESHLVWIENLGGNAPWTLADHFRHQASRTRQIHVSDIDGDADIDLVATSLDNNLSWHKNLFGKVDFLPQQVISTVAAFAQSTDLLDLDGDGDQDLVAAARNADQFLWFENENGEGFFSSEKVISDRIDDPLWVLGADLDADGDNDILGVTRARIIWYENLDGE